MKNFGHVFSIIMRQRQAANHPDLPKLAVNTATGPICMLNFILRSFKMESHMIYMLYAWAEHIYRYPM